MTMRSSLLQSLGRVRRRLCEAVGIGHYSYPGLNGLDRKLERYLDFDEGFFVEAGANDGFSQSNTYCFERLRAWTGILIEPVPELYEQCRRRRRRSRVVQAALVAPEHGGGTIRMEAAGLMSVTGDAFGDAQKRAEHLQKATEMGQCGPRGSYTVSVPAMTLSQILDREAPGREVDLLVLDVEGAELAAISGLDRARHSPRFICVEAREPAEMTALLAPTHELVAVLADNGRYQDLLLRRR